MLPGSMHLFHVTSVDAIEYIPVFRYAFYKADCVSNLRYSSHGDLEAPVQLNSPKTVQTRNTRVSRESRHRLSFPQVPRAIPRPRPGEQIMRKTLTALLTTVALLLPLTTLAVERVVLFEEWSNGW